MRDLPIGIFDSGVGGLTVLREVQTLLPEEDILYFCDSARVPYGSKSPEDIIHYTLRCLSFLEERGVKGLIIACHTASVHVSVPGSIGMVPSSLKLLRRATRNGRVAVLATQSTIDSGIYQKSVGAGVTLFPIACPLFVPLIEEALFDHEATHALVQHYLYPLHESQIDTVFLACTHYPLLMQPIRKVLGPLITIVDPARIVAEEMKERLRRAGTLCLEKKGDVRFFTTGHEERFLGLASAILRRKVSQERVTRITL